MGYKKRLMTEDNFKILGHRDFKDMNLPPILYKYRDWNNPDYKRVLTENEVYLPSPANFKDKFDCKVPIRYDLLKNKDIYNKYLFESKKNNQTFKRQQHRQFARDWVKKGLLKDEKRIKDLDDEFFKEFNRNFGVFSLTAIPDNYEMWEKYSAEHSGFCVGFNTIPLLNLSQYFKGGGVVSYSDELPIIMPFELFEKQHYFQIYSKLKKFKFEEEFRLRKDNIENRKVKIPTEIYCKIILGAKISNDSKDEILKIAKYNFPNVKLLQAVIENNSVILNKIEI